MQTLETLGNYQIRRELGRGAIGIVYEAWDPRIERSVALKTVRIPNVADDELREEFARFRREARAAGRLVHPNIVTVYEYGETGDLAYIAMEFIGGPSLKSLLEQRGRLTLPDIMLIMQDVLDGLQYSHDRGVVHRDIKPANIMLTTGDRTTARAKIADFGIARIESSSMTQAGTIMGTPAYMSPEQLVGQPVDARTDIYSAGVLLYQLLTGDRPFEGGLSAVMHKALNTEPPAPSKIAVTIPPGFDTVVRRAMAKRPADRYASAAAFAGALIAANSTADDQTIIAPRPHAIGPAPRPHAISAASPRPASRVEPIPPERSRLRLMVAGAAGLAVVAGGATIWLVQPPAQPAPQVPPAVAVPSMPPPSPGADPSAVAPEAVAPTIPTTPVPPPPAPTPVVATPADPIVVPPVPIVPSETSATVRARLEAILGMQRCALVDGSVADNRDVTLTGLASADGLDQMRRLVSAIPGVGAIDWRGTIADARYCPALAALLPAWPRIGLGEPGLGLDLAGGRSRLAYDDRQGDRIHLRVGGQPFPAYLTVDYIANDGGVQHLYPQQADPRAGFDADPVVSVAPGQPLNLGDTSPGHPGWEVGQPPGTDMIIAVGSSQPLFASPRPGNAESATDYIRDLAAAIERARAAGIRLSATVQLVEVVAK